LAAFRSVLALRWKYLVPQLRHARSLGAEVIGNGAIRAGWQLGEGQWWLAFNLGDTEVLADLPYGETVLQLGEVGHGQLLAPAALLVRRVQA
jgi:maltooligosyltrehalose trehalohydrolase